MILTHIKFELNSGWKLGELRGSNCPAIVRRYVSMCFNTLHLAVQFLPKRKISTCYGFRGP